MAALHSAPRKLILSFSFSKRSFILNHYYHYWFIFSFHFFSSTQEATLRPNVKLAIEKLCCAQWSFSVSFLLKIGRILRFALEEQSFAVRNERHFCWELFRWFLVETTEHKERGDTSYHPTSRLINLIKFNQICGAFLVFSKFFIIFSSGTYHRKVCTISLIHTTQIRKIFVNVRSVTKVGSTRSIVHESPIYPSLQLKIRKIFMNDSFCFERWDYSKLWFFCIMHVSPIYPALELYTAKTLLKFYLSYS